MQNSKRLIADNIYTLNRRESRNLGQNLLEAVVFPILKMDQQCLSFRTLGNHMLQFFLNTNLVRMFAWADSRDQTLH